MLYKKMSFSVFGDNRGSLVSLEENKNIPFDIKRVYYIFNTKKDIKRGFHAHKSLKQVLICVSGSCDIALDNGAVKETVTLSSPIHGVFIDKMIWREMLNFSEDCVLMVIADCHYDESEYIRNYEEFLKLAKVN